MKSTPLLLATAALLALEGAVAAQTPATGPADGAAEALDRIRTILSAKPTSRADADRMVKEELPKVLTTLSEMEAKYPKAEQLHEARAMGLKVAAMLARLKKDPLMAAQAEGIAKNILASKPSPEAMLFADYHVVMMQIRPVGADEPTAGAAKLVEAFVARYRKTNSAGDAMVRALGMAQAIEDEKLFETLGKRFLKEHADHHMAAAVRSVLGLGSATGKPFEAVLTKLDGTKLTLPKDLLGKVVVVDFWATWCGPCVAEIPHMKEVYAKYKDKGVEFVGISLDRSKDKLTEFIKAKGLGWVHTFSGGGDDPTARKYGIRGIPAVWVIGKDGKIINTRARGRLEHLLDKALAPAPTTRPAKKAAE